MRILFCFCLCFGFAFGNYGKPQLFVQYLPQPEFYPPQHPPATTTSEPQESEPPELAPLDEEKVQEFFAQYCQFYNKKDHESLLGLYADDVVYIQTGSDIMDKKKLSDKLKEDLETDEMPCDESIDVLSGDYYYPYLVAHYYQTEGYYGAKVAHQVFSNVLRLNEKGEYEIVLENVFDLVVEQNAPEEKPPQPYGYQAPKEASAEEKPSEKKSSEEKSSEKENETPKYSKSVEYHYLPSPPEEKPMEKTYVHYTQPKSKKPEASNPPQVYYYKH